MANEIGPQEIVEAVRPRPPPDDLPHGNTFQPVRSASFGSCLVTPLVAVQDQTSGGVMRDGVPGLPGPAVDARERPDRTGPSRGRSHLGAARVNTWNPHQPRSLIDDACPHLLPSPTLCRLTPQGRFRPTKPPRLAALAARAPRRARRAHHGDQPARFRRWVAPRRHRGHAGGRHGRLPARPDGHHHPHLRRARRESAPDHQWTGRRVAGDQRRPFLADL